MRLLFDENLSFRLCGRLADLFPGSVQVRLEGLEHADDRAIWDHARLHGLVVVTHDADFADLAALLGPPPQVLLLRGGNSSTDEVEALLRRHADAIRNGLADPELACLELI